MAASLDWAGAFSEAAATGGAGVGVFPAFFGLAGVGVAAGSFSVSRSSSIPCSTISTSSSPASRNMAGLTTSALPDLCPFVKPLHMKTRCIPAARNWPRL